jgi:hypothetical protein
MQLKEFSGEDRALLISVPYRVGMWISNVDDIKGSSRDDRRERQTLSIAISRLAKNHRKMPFAAAVMQAIDQQKAQWPQWQSNISEASVLGDLEKALNAVIGSGTKRDLSEYKHAVWQIAMVVAQAYDEDDDPDNEMHIDNFFEWVGGFVIKPKLKKRPDYISAAEKQALKKLKAILKAS